MSHATIYQENKSAILLETNGKMSSSKRTKHIKMSPTPHADHLFTVRDEEDPTYLPEGQAQ